MGGRARGGERRRRESSYARARAEVSNIYDVQRRRDINGESQQPEPDQALGKVVVGTRSYSHTDNSAANEGRDR